MYHSPTKDTTAFIGAHRGIRTILYGGRPLRIVQVVSPYTLVRLYRHGRHTERPSTTKESHRTCLGPVYRLGAHSARAVFLRLFNYLRASRLVHLRTPWDEKIPSSCADPTSAQADPPKNYRLICSASPCSASRCLSLPSPLFGHEWLIGTLEGCFRYRITLISLR